MMHKLLLTTLLLTTGLMAQTFNVSTAQEFSDALNSAANNTEEDTIILEAGTYLADDYIQFQYITKDHSNLTIKAAAGLSKSDVIIDGNQKSRVLALIDEDIENGVSQLGLYTIENVTITNGKSGTVGGGIKSSYPLLLNSVDVTHNYAKIGGGGIWLQGAFELKDCNVSDNNISDLYQASGDAAIHPEYFGSQLNYDSKIINSIFSYNIAPYAQTGGSGYGILRMPYQEGTLNIENSTFTSNKGRGGALYSEYLNIRDSNFTSNSGLEGGAISGRIVDIENVSFKKNYSSSLLSNSSAIYIAGNGHINNSVFDGNSGSSHVVNANETIISESIFKIPEFCIIIDNNRFNSGHFSISFHHFRCYRPTINCMMRSTGKYPGMSCGLQIGSGFP